MSAGVVAFHSVALTMLVTEPAQFSPHPLVQLERQVLVQLAPVVQLLPQLV